MEVDVGLLADQVGVSATNTLDLGQGVHDLLLSVNIGVEKTEDELEVRLFAGYERYITIIAIPSVLIKAIILSIFIKSAFFQPPTLGQLLRLLAPRETSEG